MKNTASHSRDKLTFTLEEAADCLKIHPNRLIDLINQDPGFPAVKFGRSWTIPADDLMQYIRDKLRAAQQARRAEKEKQDNPRRGGGRRLPPPELPPLDAGVAR